MRILLIVLFACCSVSWADPVVGREAAAGYFNQAQEAVNNISGREHYMVLHLGKLVNTNAWNWGSSGRQKNAGSASVGVTYRVGEWKDLTDTAIRIDFNEYDIEGQKPQKLSFLGVLQFPEAASEFPLYFGAAIGPGIFFKQVGGEASLTLDYQLLVGIRFFDVFENVGFSIESGLKNHIQIGDDGQVNSAFLTAGAVFTF